jgi:hypothetical protein
MPEHCKSDDFARTGQIVLKLCEGSSKRFGAKFRQLHRIETASILRISEPAQPCPGLHWEPKTRRTFDALVFGIAIAAAIMSGWRSLGGDYIPERASD